MGKEEKSYGNNPPRCHRVAQCPYFSRRRRRMGTGAPRYICANFAARQSQAVLMALPETIRDCIYSANLTKLWLI